MPPARLNRRPGRAPRRWFAAGLSNAADARAKPSRRGDLLARLDDKEALATLNDLRALEEFQHREFDRQAQLLARGVATSQAYQRAESDLARIQAQIAAQAQRLEYFKLVAPMDGIVLKEDGEVGDMVDPGTILYRIGLEKPLWVVADVNEEDIPRVQVGQKALLRTDAFAGQVLPGFVKQITPAGDPVSKTFRVRIGLPDDTPLRVGMSVEANIVSREKLDVVLVPANAVVDNHLLAIENDRVRPRKVEIGIRGAGFVEIVNGATEGELVASPATTNIKDGSRVRPIADRTGGRREPDPDHRLDPRPPPRPPDAGGDCGGHDRSRFFRDDGGDDGGVAGRFHQDPGRCAAAYFDHGRIAPADAATRRPALSRRGIPRPHPGGAPAGHQEPDGHHRVAEDLGTGSPDAVGAVEGRAALCRPQPHHLDHRHRSPHRGRRLDARDPYAAGNADVALPFLQRHPARRPPGQQDRRASQFQHHAGVRRGRQHERHRGRHLPFRLSCHRRDHRLCPAQDRAGSRKADRHRQRNPRAHPRSDAGPPDQRADRRTDRVSNRFRGRKRRKTCCRQSRCATC